MSNIIKKALVFDKQVLVAGIDSTDLCEEARSLHNLSHTATAALGRTLTACAFMAKELKTDTEKLSITIDGNGPLGKIIVSGNGKGELRGFVENPTIELPPKYQGKLDVGAGVGKNGEMTVIKDLGLKKPYYAKIPLVSGEIAEDFASYYFQSEQRPSVVALGVNLEQGHVTSAGGLIIQLLPNCPDHIITIIEDIATNFNAISSLMKEKSIEEIIDYYFGHFEIEYLPDVTFEYKCSCDVITIRNIIKNLGKTDAYNLLSEQNGQIKVHCDYCNKDYVFTEKELNAIFN